MAYQLFHKALAKVCRFAAKESLEALCYKALIDSYSRLKSDRTIGSLNENGIRDRFIVDILQNSTLIREAIDNYTIIIIPENWNPERKNRTDITFKICPLKRDLILECKKLSCANQLYVSAGLARFINLAYAEKEPDAGMIGFVVSKSLTQTMKGLKIKVADFHMIEMVDELVYGFEHSFKSVHERENLTQISLSHLFFDFDN